jgi:hypothetical protein
VAAFEALPHLRDGFGVVLRFELGELLSKPSVK